LSDRKKSGGSPPPFPEITEKWGENPARILIRNIDPRPRLRAIDDVEQLEDWRLVEKRCRNRTNVLEYIDNRIRAVQNDRDGFLEPETLADPRTDHVEAVTDGGTETSAGDGTAGGTDDGSAIGTYVGTHAGTSDDDQEDDVDDDSPPDECPDCESSNVKVEELGGERALWCGSCSDFTLRLGGVDA
jgi:hypothetical protein